MTAIPLPGAGLVEVSVPEPSHAPPPAAPRRLAIPEGGGEERVYGAVFGRVWIAALAAVRSMSRWALVDSNSVRGELHVEVRGTFSKRIDQAWIRLRLDELGLTRVEADFHRRGGESLSPLKRRQISGFYRTLESILATDR